MESGCPERSEEMPLGQISQFYETFHIFGRFLAMLGMTGGAFFIVILSDQRESKDLSVL